MRIQPLRPDFGAEILDFDILQATQEDVEQLRSAYDKYQLLLFRGQGRIPPERHVEIGGWFGPLVCDGEDGAMWSILHNETSGGSAKLQFHCDHSYTESPIKTIALHAIELPGHPTATAFVSALNAWATLPAERQELLAPMTLHHRHVTKNFDWPVMIGEHRLRLPRPRTGQPILFITEQNAYRIPELEPAESDRMIAELLAHVYAPKNIYMHQWEPHDLLIWDNLAIQHARPVEAKLSDGARVMQRVALNEVPFPELLARARVREAATAN